ncbi:MAG: pyridoxamine 5'-phosphate oxidase family protein [Candidatus Hodarchaeota archaeon]
MNAKKKDDGINKPREQVISESVGYLESHNIMTMATASLDGTPNASALEYANDGLDVVVFSRGKSWKVTNIRENPKVFYEVHDDLKIDRESLRRIIGLQVAASAEIVDSNDPRYEPLYGLMEKKFPVFKGIPKQQERVILLFKPNKLWLLDYSKKFFHRDEISFNE